MIKPDTLQGLYDAVWRLDALCDLIQDSDTYAPLRLLLSPIARDLCDAVERAEGETRDAAGT